MPRERLAYWSYWAVFLGAPAMLLGWVVLTFELSGWVTGIGGVVLWLAATGPGEHIYRWWCRRVWCLDDRRPGNGAA